MAWETLKQTLLTDTAALFDKNASDEHTADLHSITSALLGRFAAEDLRNRTADNIYGMVYGLRRFMQTWDVRSPKVRILNPDIARHGWESKSTVLVALCENIPFCTASVRGELNRRGLGVLCIASCNLQALRDSKGELQQVLNSDSSHDAPRRLNGAESSQPITQVAEDHRLSDESLLYFELTRHSNLDDLAELRDTLTEILEDVGHVVRDFDAMRERLASAHDLVLASEIVDEDYRNEAAEFLAWLRKDHLTFLGYEYLTVAEGLVQAVPEQRLGVLRSRPSRGVSNLQHETETMPTTELLRRQLSFGKSRTRARVHRQVYPDYVEIKQYDPTGQVLGQHRFLGLFTADVYGMDPAQIPIVRRKLGQVIERSGLSANEHDGRELKRVLEMMPRDELFQSSSADLYRIAAGVNRIQERRQTRLFVRRDPRGNFVSCLLYMPRDLYSTQQRIRIQSILSDTFAAEEAEFNTQFTESVLVRVYIVLRVDPKRQLEFDLQEIEEQIVQATLAWGDRLRNSLVEEFGEERGEQLMRELGEGFAAGYQDDFDPRVAVLDIKNLLRLKSPQGLALHLYRQLEEADNHLKFRLYRESDPLPLSDVLPILEDLGLRVVAERAYPVRHHQGKRYWIQEFSLIYSLAAEIDLQSVKEEFEDAFARIWNGEAESDTFNRLLLGSRLAWREIALLRAYACYFGQINFPYSRAYIAQTMADHLPISGLIVELFLTRFSPAFDGDEDWRIQREESLAEKIYDALDQVPNLGQDRIIRHFVDAIRATLRTNFFQESDRGAPKDYFSFKIRPSDIPEVPRPVPMFEIYVYSPRVEGVHLRGGKVARGGLRWSDRLEDFRTEVLGLVKAQQVKNAVIVPVGAKGGFVAKRLRADMSRDEIQAEGIACYQTFIRGLLDITDNREEDRVTRPSLTVCKDEPDPYLVVAADKGTASFSDIANELALEYDFWLGDAFASGGSVGYDHKKMGITARGAWVSVERHFRELGINVATDEVSVIGIGDMSGDVFGNGMLLSEHLCLVAAFNHLHIFIDPNPDAQASFRERERLFGLPRSGWGDYDTQLISEGGGVFSRSSKSIPISPQMRERFSITAASLTPNQLISAILKSKVDLLWNGGIGTYVKAHSESHTDVGDKANDALRVDAQDLQCRVIGEGGNLGITQLARIEYGMNGGRSNTDFIDNAGGVDCSDHEVNIKILLNTIVSRGDMTTKNRNELLEGMTEDVARLVLGNNYRQVQTISLAEFEARHRGGEYQRLISHLEDAGGLDRELEFIPSDEALTERAVQGKGLTRPELAVLVSYSKSLLKEQLIGSDLARDARMDAVIATAFPRSLVDAYPEDVKEHRLVREIMCTQLANDMVNRMGLSYVMRQVKATGVEMVDVARAYSAMLDIYGVAELWDQIEALDFEAKAETQLEMMLELIRLIKRATRWVLRNRRREIDTNKIVEEFAASNARLGSELKELLRGRAAEHFAQRREFYIDAGIDPEMGDRVALCSQAHINLALIDVANSTHCDLIDAAKLYYSLGERLELDWFGAQIASSVVDNEWQAMARESYLEDLQWQQCTLARGVISLHRTGEAGCDDIVDCLDAWEEQQRPLLKRWRDMLSELQAVTVPDFAMYAVANRELLDLAQSTRQG
ncbi:MAG: NAD-glutamate dehydrogenase [Pseudomonadota bacterium]